MDSTGALTTAQQPSLTVVGRAPGASDDSTRNFAVGQNWVTPNGHVLQSASATAGLALWQDVTPGCLPLDCLGENITAATPTTAGSGYVTGNTVLGSHGETLTVTASGGAVTALAVTTPNYYGCSTGGTVTGETFTSLTGTGTGLVATLNLSYDTAVGVHKLTACYTGNDMNVVRTDSGASKDIGFASGAIDAATAWNFGQGTTLRIAYAYDQGGGSGAAPSTGSPGNSLNQTTAAYRPAITPLRMQNGVPTILCDGNTANAYGIPNYTFLNIPAGVALTNRTMAGAMLFGVVSAARPQIPIQLNGSSGFIFQSGPYGVPYSMKMGGANLNLPNTPQDSGNVLLWNTSLTGNTAFLNDFSVTSSAYGSVALAGGNLCSINTSNANGEIDVADFILVPRSLTAAEQSLLETSLYAIGGSRPQARNEIIVAGDSHNDGTGAAFQQSWARQLATLMNRPDIQFVNQAIFGTNLSSQVQYALPAYGVPALTNAAGSYWRNKIVILEGGTVDIGGPTFSGTSISGTLATFTAGTGGVVGLNYVLTGAGVTAGTVINGQVGGTFTGNTPGTYTVNNSQTVGSETMTLTATPAALYAYYVQAAQAVHAAGGKFVCQTTILRSNTSNNNSLVSSLNGSLQLGCDKVNHPSTYDTTMLADGIIDQTVLPAFNSISGPWPAPIFTSDGVHLTAYGQAQQASIAINQLMAQHLILSP